MAVMEQRGCLLLDEWAADQDPRFRKIFYRELLPRLKERGVTVIAITHDDKYFDAADRVFKMDMGVLTELSVSEQRQNQTIFSQIIS
jgi:putative ATP-binding cassette transporter